MRFIRTIWNFGTITNSIVVGKIKTRISVIRGMIQSTLYTGRIHIQFIAGRITHEFFAGIDAVIGIFILREDDSELLREDGTNYLREDAE